MRQDKDCLKIFRSKVLGSLLLEESQLNAIDQKVFELVDGAVTFARGGHEPSPADLTHDVYLNYQD